MDNAVRHKGVMMPGYQGTETVTVTTVVIMVTITTVEITMDTEGMTIVVGTEEDMVVVVTIVTEVLIATRTTSMIGAVVQGTSATDHQSKGTMVDHSTGTIHHQLNVGEALLMIIKGEWKGTVHK